MRLAVPCAPLAASCACCAASAAAVVSATGAGGRARPQVRVGKQGGDRLGLASWPAMRSAAARRHAASWNAALAASGVGEARVGRHRTARSAASCASAAVRAVSSAASAAAVSVGQRAAALIGRVQVGGVAELGAELGAGRPRAWRRPAPRQARRCAARSARPAWPCRRRWRRRGRPARVADGSGRRRACAKAAASASRRSASVSAWRAAAARAAGSALERVAERSQPGTPRPRERAAPREALREVADARVDGRHLLARPRPPRPRPRRRARVAASSCVPADRLEGGSTGSG